MTKPGPKTPSAAEIKAARDAETKKTLEWAKKELAKQGK